MSKSLKKSAITTIITFVILLVLVLIFIFPVRLKIAANYLAKADQYYAERNFENAEKYYQKTLFWQTKTEDPVYYKLAVSQYNLGQYNKSIESYKNSLDNPLTDRVSVLNNMGNVWRSSNDFTQAIKYYDQAIEQIKANLAKLFDRTPFINKTATLALMGKYQDAIDQANTYIKDYPQYFTQDDFQKLIDFCQEKLKQ